MKKTWLETHYCIGYPTPVLDPLNLAEEEDDLVSDSINHEAICRAAPGIAWVSY